MSRSDLDFDRDFTLRDATSADLPAIVAIYNQSILSGRSTADLAPVSVDSRRAWFALFDPQKRPIWVVETEGETSGEIAGCIYLTSFYGGRAAYDKTAEVSLYIDQNHHNRGLGSELLAKMIAFCPRIGVTTLLGMHFDHNEATLRLNRKFGFEIAGHLTEIAEIDGQKRGLLISVLRIAEAE